MANSTISSINMKGTVYDIEDTTARQVATTSQLGRVKPDGTTVTVDNDGTIHSTGGGASTLNGLSDVTITSPAAGQVLRHNGSGWENGTIDVSTKERIVSTRTNTALKLKIWTPKTWNGFTSFQGNGIWTDGENIYCSVSTTHYVLDKATSTWSTKTWNGLSYFAGTQVWTDGDNIYCSPNTNSKHYVLDKATSTWTEKTWSGLTNFDGNGIWTDGENIYYSKNSTTQYVLNKATSTWSPKTWNGTTAINAPYVWTDGENIYYSNSYVLDKSTSTWLEKTWNGFTNFSGDKIWSDGENIYYSSSTSHYVLNKATSTWSTKTWKGLTNFDGNKIWTDEETIYYSNGATQYILTTKYTDNLKTSSSSGGVSSLDDLSDVTVSSPSNGQVLQHNGTNWVNGTINTVPTGGTTGQALTKHSDANNDVEWTDVATPTYVKNNYTSRDLLTDTVGWTGKNLMPNHAASSSIKGIDYIVNSDGSVKANGTNNTEYWSELPIIGTQASFEYGELLANYPSLKIGDTYIFSGGSERMPSSNGRLGLYFVDSNNAKISQYNLNFNDENFVNGLSITIPSGAIKWLVCLQYPANASPNNEICYPMIRRATESAGYEPYHDSVEETLRDAEVIEGKNLADYHAQKEITRGITLTDTGTGYKISGSSVGHWAKYGFYTKVPKNTNCVLSIDVTITSDDALIKMIGATGSINTEITSQVISSSGAQTIQFNSGNYDFVWIGLYITNASSSSGDVTYNNIMICTQEDWDKSHEYKPYYEPLKDRKLDITDEQVLGAWNLAQNNGTTQTLNGATYTKNADDTVTVNVAGSAVTATTKYILSSTTDVYVPLPDRLKPGETYYLSGCTGGNYSGTDGGSDTFFLWVNFRDANNLYLGNVICSKAEKAFTIPANAMQYEMGINIYAAAGKLTGKVFSPMISLKPNMPYVPYVMTNKELTDNKFGYTNGLTNIDANTLTKNGFYVLQSNITNVPVTYAVLQVISYGSRNDAGVIQILYPFGYNGEIYTRRRWDNTWRDWYKFTGTVVQ